ncbi:GGDEF domain-containing protein [Piscinibacter gummiphilus]|uniref:diguanylate cyclase n=1 Tax=Piscinibacter gummiphilus TaxID=946333 RepID=A0ABZ0CXD6_9BURK|nr:GGDEF domain-containing protein [Piscinibacter gummiphilus]WOB09617.1 GGDEF domain-containing protein [Piscinibacter gummiphilus]
MSNAAMTAPPPAFEPRAEAEGDAHARTRRRVWMVECAVIGASYVLNGVLMSLFALGGTVHWSAGVCYGLPGVLLSATCVALIATGASERTSDPSFSKVQAYGNAALTLVGVALFPQLAFAYALSLFILMLTATYRMPKRQLHVMLAVVVLLFAALTFGQGQPLTVPDSTPLERWLSLLFFVVSLGRCVFLSVINTHNNRLLRERGIEMQAKLAEIERLAHHDELTGVLNRRRMMHFLGEELARHDRNGAQVSVALLDLDHFKAVNDTLGHLAGDEVLRRFAAAVQRHARNTDRFGRYGGEEFLVILNDATTDAALQAIERMRAAVATIDWSHLSPELRVTFSAGIATYNGNESVEVLLSRADLGLYEAKRCGRNCSRAL